MKIAYHFNADHEELDDYYGLPLRRAVFSSIIHSRTIKLHTKVFQGDLLLYMHTFDRQKTEDGEIHTHNPERFQKAVETLLFPGTHIWMTFTPETSAVLLQNNIFVIVFESISFRDAQELDKSLRNQPWYLGGLQIDETCPVHWIAYSSSLSPAYRIIEDRIHLFWDGIEEGSIDEGHLDELRDLGFTSACLESLNGKFTIFDSYHDFQHARRIAELSSALTDALSMGADQVITRFSDAAPDLGNKLWSAIRTYDRAEVPEDYAQVATSCRRVLEYVADSIFPPGDNTADGRKMGQSKYRNRLLAFADRERASDTNIDLICVSTELLADQLEKLSKLTNKGVHTEISRHEARRCLLRTIMVLDDILSLRKDPLARISHQT